MEDAHGIGSTVTCAIDPARAAALYAALGLDRPAPGVGDALIPFAHQVYFWDSRPPSVLGRDGHPAQGAGPVPDMGLPRRMWAGGRLVFHGAFRAGVRAEKHTTLAAITRKTGRSGPLAFATLRHDIRQRGALVVTEWQDIVYRADPAPDAPPPEVVQAQRDEFSRNRVEFDPVLLFRYSALTFNGHRIHYDQPYAREVEGYGGLVVHGPLLAQLLMLKAEADIGPLREFTFRATAALVHTETAELCAKGRDLWVRGPDGRLCMTATAR
jgi:3-methylfumaryl-CoA hydratase